MIDGRNAWPADELRSVQTVHESTVRLSDGAATTVQRWGERGPLIVAIHGLGSSRRGWSRLAEHLSANMRIAAYDQRGHGDATASGPMTLSRTVEDAGDVVRSLGEPVHALIGHSWGGAVAIAAAPALAVSRVVAIDPMLRVAPGIWSSSVLAEYVKLFEQPPEARESAIRSWYAAYPPVELDGKLHATRRLQFDSVAALGTDNAIDEGRWDLHPAVRDYPKPLLFVLADPRRSAVLEPERDEIRAAGGPNVRIVVLSGASHSLQRDAFDRFTPVVDAFLSDAAPPSGK